MNSHPHPQINGPTVFHILHIMFLEVCTNYVVFKVIPGDLIEQKSCMKPIAHYEQNPNCDAKKPFDTIWIQGFILFLPK